MAPHFSPFACLLALSCLTCLHMVNGVSVSSYFTAVKLNYFKSYGSMQLLTFEVPCDAWYLTVFLQPGKTAPECADKPIYSILSPYGLPLVDFTEYPEGFLTTPQLMTQISFNMSTSVFELRSEILKPRCGTWYLGVVLRDSFDEGSVITNKDLKKTCYYFMGGGVTSELVSNVPMLDTYGLNKITVSPSKPSPYPIIDGALKLVGFYKFRPLSSIVSKFSIVIAKCEQNISGNITRRDPCPIDIASRAAAPPSQHSFSDNIFVSCRYIALSECVLPVWPIWSESLSWHYLAVWMNESEVDLNIELKFEYNECSTLESTVPKHPLAGVSFGSPNSTSYVSGGHLAIDGSIDSDEIPGDFPQNIYKNRSSAPLIKFYNGANESTCVVSPEMTRLLVVTQSSYSPIFFMADSTGLLGNRLPINPGQYLIVPLKIDSKFDNGGTLRLRIFLDTIKSSPEVSVGVCLQWRHVPLFNEKRARLKSGCPFGFMKVFSTANNSNADDVIAVPYPKMGVWLLAFYGSCVSANCSKSATAYATFELYSTRCVDVAPNQCSHFGTCSEVNTLAGRISACSCVAGYRGYGCTDVREAVPDALARTLFVTLSNLAFLPAIFVAINWGHFVPAAVYTYNMFFSSFYHWCDSSLFSWCLTKPDALQFADFLASVASFWTTLVTMATIGNHTRLFAHVVGLLLISFATSLDRFSLWTFLAPFLASVVIMATSWIFRSVRHRRVYPPKTDLFRLIPGVILCFCGLLVYTFLETPSNYEYTHGSWHILIMFATVFLLPRPLKGNSCFPTGCGTSSKRAKSSTKVVGSSSLVMFPLLDLRFYRILGQRSFWRSHINSCCDYPDEPDQPETEALNKETPCQSGEELSPTASPVAANGSEDSSSIMMPFAGGVEQNASTSSMVGLIDPTHREHHHHHPHHLNLHHPQEANGLSSGDVFVNVDANISSNNDGESLSAQHTDTALYSRL